MTGIQIMSKSAAERRISVTCLSIHSQIPIPPPTVFPRWELEIDTPCRDIAMDPKDEICLSDQGDPQPQHKAQNNSRN